MDRYYEYTDRLNTPIEAFTHITYDYNFPILPHWHYFIECIYLTAGNLLVTCDENVYSLQPGDFIFFPPKTLHTIDVFPTDFEQSQAEKPSQDPAFTLKSQDFLKNPSLHGYLPNFPLSACPLRRNLYRIRNTTAFIRCQYHIQLQMYRRNLPL